MMTPYKRAMSSLALSPQARERIEGRLRRKPVRRRAVRRLLRLLRHILVPDIKALRLGGGVKRLLPGLRLLLPDVKALRRRRGGSGQLLLERPARSLPLLLVKEGEIGHLNALGLGEDVGIRLGVEESFEYIRQ